MKQLVLTILGEDKPGLVEQISSTVSTHQGSWLASNLSHLCGLFAGLVQIEVSEDKLQNLRDALLSLPDLDIQIRDRHEHEHHDNTEKLNLVITGNDRVGIVQELSEIIRHKGANIVHFTSQQQSAPNWGVPLFNAVANIELPVGMDSDEVVDALESFANDLTVDVEPAA